MNGDSPIPEDCLRLKDSLTEQFAALRASIETHPVVGNTLLVSSLTSLAFAVRTRYATEANRPTYLRILVELVSSNEVYREDDLDVVCLCLLDEGGDLLRASLVEERVADLATEISKRLTKPVRVKVLPRRSQGPS